MFVRNENDDEEEEQATGDLNKSLFISLSLVPFKPFVGLVDVEPDVGTEAEVVINSDTIEQNSSKLILFFTPTQSVKIINKLIKFPFNFTSKN